MIEQQKEDYRKRRLAYYNAAAREVWSDREEAEKRLHLFAHATFGDDVVEGGQVTLRNIPLDYWMDREMSLWLSRMRLARERMDRERSLGGAQVDARGRQDNKGR